MKKLLLFLLILLTISSGVVFAAENAEMVFTLEELAEYDGKDGRSAYVAVDGIVYDVTDSPSWAEGEHNGLYAGKDLTPDLSKAPHGAGVLGKYPVVGKLEGSPSGEKKEEITLYSLLGVVSLASLCLMVVPFIITRVLKSKNKTLKAINIKLRKIHKSLGIILVIVSLVHGYMALGGFKLHTGSLLFISIVLTGIFGMAFNANKKKILLMIHRFFALLSFILLGLHLLVPWLI